MKRVLAITAILLLALMPVGVYAEEIIEEADCEKVTAVSEETTVDIETGDIESSEIPMEQGAADMSTSEESEPEPQETPSEEPLIYQPLPEEELLPSEPSEPVTEPEQKTEEVVEDSPAPAVAKPDPLATAKARISNAVRSGSEYVNLEDLGIKFEDTPGFVDYIMSNAYLEEACGFALINTDGTNNSKLAGVILFYDDCDCEDEEDCEDEGNCEGESYDDTDDTVTPSEEYLAAEDEPAEDEVADTEEIPSEPVIKAVKSEKEPAQDLPPAPIGAISVPVLLAAVTKYLH